MGAHGPLSLRRRRALKNLGHMTGLHYKEWIHSVKVGRWKREYWVTAVDPQSNIAYTWCYMVVRHNGSIIRHDPEKGLCA